MGSTSPEPRTGPFRGLRERMGRLLASIDARLDEEDTRPGRGRRRLAVWLGGMIVAAILVGGLPWWWPGSDEPEGRVPELRGATASPMPGSDPLEVSVEPERRGSPRVTAGPSA